MDNQRPRPDAAGKSNGDQGKGKPPNPLLPETRLSGDSATPTENDPRWDEIGNARVVEGQSDVPETDNLDSPSNHTELSPLRVLGKNLVRIGDYRLVKKIGQGAMGAVYKAKQVSDDGKNLDKPRTVALKVLFPHVANNPKLVERMNREGQVMGLLDHPNIVRAFAVGEADECHFVAMEYVSGQSMQKWLLQLGTLEVGDAVRVTIDCARALAYAHAQKIVHRDIKPDNILLTRTGIVKVADLGMVKMNDEDMSLTQTGHAVGTPWYMPLEQARNAKEIDGRSDIYALGCTLFALLTGEPPFVGRTIVDVIRAKEAGTFPPARQSNVNVPERLDLIIAKMTAKAPKNRYQTCDEVVRDLESLNLASSKLTFIHQKPIAPSSDSPLLGKTTLRPTEAQSKADADLSEVSAASSDPDVWYVQSKQPDGKIEARRYTTAQVKKMLVEGTIKVTASISHSPDDGFRAVATYKEFQGSAASNLSKQSADKNTARYRGLYKKIEEADRQREEKERADKETDKGMSANTRYWMSLVFMVLPIVLGLIFVIGFLYWIASMF
jgi:eukaryotic-like serine/threonine-protein kinase